MDVNEINVYLYEMNDINKQCLNCGEILIHTEGKREKVFCDTTCRSNYWQKSDRLEKKGLSVEEIVAAIRKTWQAQVVAVFPKGVKDEHVQAKKAIENGQVKNIPYKRVEQEEKPQGYPIRGKDESGFDYRVRCAEFNEQQKK